MRKITTEEEKEKSKKIKQILVGGILMFVMIMGILGYSFGGGDSNTGSKVIYNKVEFTQQGSFWFANINQMQFAFSYNPKETENISSNIHLNLNSYRQKPLYILSEDYEAESEIYRNFDQVILRSQYACLETEENKSEGCEEGRPLKTCEDNFVIIRKSNSTLGIRQDNNCVFIEGKREELARITDRFLFDILEIQ